MPSPSADAGLPSRPPPAHEAQPPCYHGRKEIVMNQMDQRFGLAPGAGVGQLSAEAAGERITAFLRTVYGWMSVGLVVTMSARVHKLAPATAAALFLGYSALTGVTMAFVLLAYTGESVASMFFVTAG